MVHLGAALLLALLSLGALSLLSAVPRAYAATEDLSSVCTGGGGVSSNVEISNGETLEILGIAGGGVSWDSTTSTCTVTGMLFISSGTTWTVDSGGSIYIDNGVNTAISLDGTLNNYGTITIATYGDASVGIAISGTLNNYGTIDILFAGDGFYNLLQDIQNYATFMNSGTIDITAIPDGACPAGCPMTGTISGPAFSLLIETMTSSGAPISTSVTVSGPGAPSSPVTTNSSGDYFFQAGTLMNGATYSVSATINGAPLSASVVLEGNSVVVLEPTASSPPVGSPQFPAFLGLLLATRRLTPVPSFPRPAPRHRTALSSRPVHTKIQKTSLAEPLERRAPRLGRTVLQRALG